MKGDYEKSQLKGVQEGLRTERPVRAWPGSRAGYRTSLSHFFTRKPSSETDKWPRPQGSAGESVLARAGIHITIEGGEDI